MNPSRLCPSWASTKRGPAATSGPYRSTSSWSAHTAGTRPATSADHPSLGVSSELRGCLRWQCTSWTVSGLHQVPTDRSQMSPTYTLTARGWDLQLLRVSDGGRGSGRMPLSCIHRAVGAGIGGGPVTRVDELQPPSGGHPSDPPQTTVQSGAGVRPVEIVKGDQCDRRASCGARFVREVGNCTRPQRPPYATFDILHCTGLSAFVRYGCILRFGPRSSGP
jgi:hypothetical protein